MSVTVSIGNSWYVLDNIIGIVGAQGDQPAKMLMSTGHVLEMADVSEEVVQHIRNLRDPRPEPMSLTEAVADMEMIDEAATAG